MTPTRRVVLGGGLAAAVWRLSGSGASGRRSCLRRLRAFSASKPRRRSFNWRRRRPNRRRLTPMPARSRARSSGSRQGEELRLKFANKLAEPTTLSFPGLRAANAARGRWRPHPRAPQTRRERRNPLRRSRFRLQSLSAARGLDRRRPSRGAGCSGRSSSTRRPSRMSIWTRRSCCPTGTSTRTGRSRTISPIPPPAEEAGAEAASFSPMARPPR